MFLARKTLVSLMILMIPVIAVARKGDKNVDRSVTFRCALPATITTPDSEYASGQAMPLHFINGIAKVTVSRPGYVDLPIAVELAETESGDYPAKGTIRLEPEHFWQPYLDGMRQHSNLTLLASLLTVAGLTVGLVARTRNRRKQKVLEKFEARRDVHDSLAMQVVGGYMLVESLGSGGMATVYRGLPHTDLDEDKAVAVKVLGREMLDDREFRERFRREVNAYRKLSHPNIVSVIDWGELEGGLIYIVLELIQGQTLRSRLGQHRLSPSLLYQVLDSLASALEHAHQRGIIHRDLKPENLMLTNSEQLRVMDFGLARHEGEERITRTDVVMGTPAYMAPEQLGARLVDNRLDQYAFGVICHELLTGQLPYSCTSGMALFGEILGGNPIPIRSCKKDFHVELEKGLLRMLCKEPNKRFSSVAEAWDAIKRYVPGSE